MQPHPDCAYCAERRRLSNVGAAEEMLKRLDMHGDEMDPDVVAKFREKAERLLAENVATPESNTVRTDP